jgi:2-polyprenyl-3-methyl-5-hydroxy-6-metoxy-1,4-benzoquinol methylase
MSHHTNDYGWTKSTPESSGYLLNAIREAIRPLKPDSLLDMGCGNGSILRGLADLCPRRCGCDADIQGLKIARQADPGATYLHTPITPGVTPQISGGPFAAIISTEVVEHLYSPDDLFVMAKAHASAATTLIVTTPYHGWLKNVALAVSGSWDKHHTSLQTGAHIKFWSRATLGALAERNGWRATHFTGVGRAPYLWKSMLMTFTLAA